MQALVVRAKQEQPVLLDMPVPAVSEGMIKLRVAACGLNFSDLLLIRGTYQTIPPYPFALGMECSGVVVECGKGVRKFRPGDRVACFSGVGGLAEYCIVDAARAVQIPDGLSLVDAAGMLITFGTAHWALSSRAKLLAGHHVAITGAAGGIGVAAVQICKALGARVTAFATGQTKCDYTRSFGADAAYDPKVTDIKSVLKADGGIDILFDSVGGQEFESCYRTIKPQGRAIIIGFASGTIPQIPANILMVKNIDVLGINWGAGYDFDPAEISNSLRTIFEMAAKRQISTKPTHIIPFGQALTGLNMLKTRRAKGKIVVTLPLG